MKKVTCLLFCICMLGIFCSACGGENGNQGEKDSFKIVTTIFPEYDWVMNILGDDPSGVEVDMLLGSGVDMHNFQPTTEDIVKINECDMFIYVGGESDEWTEDALKKAKNDGMVVINLMEALGEQVREEEVKEGMEEEEHDEDEDAAEGEEEHEYDEHVWLSPGNAVSLCSVIEEAIASMDPENADTYAANLKAYTEKINALDQQYDQAVKAGSTKTLLFGDRFPFRYLTDEYGLDYYAAFPGCSAETEASFETVLFLAKKVDELGLKNVCTIEGSDHKIAETIVENTKTKDQKVLTLDSMQSVTTEDVEKGTTWLSIMESNLEVLKEALK